MADLYSLFSFIENNIEKDCFEFIRFLKEDNPYIVLDLSHYIYKNVKDENIKFLNDIDFENCVNDFLKVYDYDLFNYYSLSDIKLADFYKFKVALFIMNNDDFLGSLYMIDYQNKYKFIHDDFCEFVVFTKYKENNNKFDDFNLDYESMNMYAELFIKVFDLSNDKVKVLN